MSQLHLCCDSGMQKPGQGRERPRTLRLLPIRGLNLLSPEISSYVAKLPPRANAEKTKGKKTNMERKARPMAREAAN